MAILRKAVREDCVIRAWAAARERGPGERNCPMCDHVMTEVPVTVRLDRPGLVRLRATITRVLNGRRVTNRIADRRVRVPRAGARRYMLRIAKAGRAALHRPGRLRLTVTARYRSPAGRVTLRRVQRLLRP